MSTPDKQLPSSVADGDAIAMDLENTTIELDDLLGAEAAQSLTQPGNQTGADIAQGLTLRGRFQLDEQIGSGGTALVFRARDLDHRERDTTGRPLAIKVLRHELHGDARALLRLKAQFACTQALSHPNIVKVFDLDHDGDVWFMTMERVDGESLSSFIRMGDDRPAPSKAHRAEIMISVAAALAYAHRQHVLHGDLKPANVMLTEDGGAKLLDFGGGPHISSAEIPALTPAYSSPQRLAGAAADASDDVYSLGCLAYELYTGRRIPNPNPGYEKAFTERQWHTISRALQVERADRESTAQDFITAFSAVSGAMPTRSARSPAGSVLQKTLRKLMPRPRRKWVFGGAVFLAAAAIALAARLVSLHEPPPRPIPVATPGPIATLAVAPLPPAPEPVAKKIKSVPKPIAVYRARVGFPAASVEVSRKNIVAALSVERSGGSSDDVRISWAAIPASATRGKDYFGRGRGSLVLHRGQNSATIYIPLAPDGEATPGSEFTVRLRRLRGPAQFTADSVVTVRIGD
jgi:serine/threonine protein kinase